MKYEVEVSNKGTSYVFSSTANRSSRATIDLFSRSIESAILTYNGDNWNNKKEGMEDVLLKLDSGEYAVCPRFTIITKSPTGEKVPTLVFRVKHPSGGKVRLYVALRDGGVVSFNFSEKLTPEEAMDSGTNYTVHAVDILRYNGLCFVSEVSKIPAEESEKF